VGRAELKQLTLERFKSYEEPTVLELAPLTVLLGRNNSGKSSLIQALLLLKQTLAYPRSDVPLHLEGAVEALSLRELTFGRPDGAVFEGPKLSLAWESDVDVRTVLGANGRWPDLDYLALHSGIQWITTPLDSVRLLTIFSISFSELNGIIVIDRIDLQSGRVDTNPQVNPLALILRNQSTGQYRFHWFKQFKPLQMKAALANRIEVELDHFIPLINIDKSSVGPRHRQRTYYNGFKVLYEKPLEDLRTLLADFHYLGPTRTLPTSIYRPATVPPEEVGVSGQYAAQMLHSRKVDLVHFVPPLEFHDGVPQLPGVVLSRSLAEAFNLVMHDLGIESDLDIEDIANVGFRLLFGGASLQHVGRGISYLLPAVLLGLVSDPLRFKEPREDLSLAEYLELCPTRNYAAIEEPETHLHPKIQTRLAHWFTALGMAGRRFLVETHSDHMVRRLRGLIARAPAGSELETWLTKNVVIAEVEQKEDGRSHLTCLRLTEPGGIGEHWPADFMDEAADEERAIYYAGLDKEDDSGVYAPDTEFIHDPVEE
jgi:predicted ATPase